MITDLSPALLGHEVNARPIKPRRVPDPARAADPAVPAPKVTRDPVDGMLTGDELAHWPTTLHTAGYYASGERLEVPTC